VRERGDNHSTDGDGVRERGEAAERTDDDDDAFQSSHDEDESDPH
jgi:hypothetical protein